MQSCWRCPLCSHGQTRLGELSVTRMSTCETTDAADGRTVCPAQGPAKVSCPSQCVAITLDPVA